MSSDALFEQIKPRILAAIRECNFDLEKMGKFISGFKSREMFEKIKLFSQNIQLFDDSQKLNLFGNIFTIIKNYLKEIQAVKQESIILSKEFISEFIDQVINLLVLEKFCSECNSTNIENLYFPISEDRVIYYCRNCGKNVRVFQKAQYLPLLLIYINEWTLRIKQKKLKIDGTPTGNERDFITIFLNDSFNFFRENGNVNSFLLFYRMFERNKLSHELLFNKKRLKTILIEKMMKSLKNHDFYDFLEGKQFYAELFGDVLKEVENLLDLILSMVIESLKSGDFFKIKYAIEHFIEGNNINIGNLLSNPKIKAQIERNYYEGLGKSLQMKHFESFRQLLEYSSFFDIFLDVKKIPNRFEFIASLLLGCVQTLGLGEIINILSFCNEYNLLEEEISDLERTQLQDLKHNKIFMANLHDLFGKLSDSFLLYINNTMPSDLYSYFINDSTFFLPYTEPDQIVSSVLEYFNRYAIYGLSVENIGRSSRFLRLFDQVYLLKKFSVILNMRLNSLSRDEYFEVLMLCDGMGVFKKHLDSRDLKFLEKIGKYGDFLTLLNNLIPNISKYMLLFASKFMPQSFFVYTTSEKEAAESLFDNFKKEDIISKILLLLRNFETYKISSALNQQIKRFIENQEKLLDPHQCESLNTELKIIKFNFLNRTHLVSPENIELNRSLIVAKNNYKFYSLSMVLLGGLGPQGHGFTYSTPKGEVVEICSDIKENEAIIVKYKQFLKQQFLLKLEKQMEDIAIDPKTNLSVITYLSEVLINQELINFYKKDKILKQIKNYLKEYTDKNFHRFNDLMEKIAESIIIILRPIQMADQFKCRMDLVAENKIKSEDIAKMTSLKEKSHYDVLRERVFFQHITDRFYENFSNAVNKYNK